MGSTFVALSRVKKFEDLRVKPFNFDRFGLLASGTYVEDRAEAMSKLEEIEFLWDED